MKILMLVISSVLLLMSGSSFAVTVRGASSCGAWILHRNALRQIEQSAQIGLNDNAFDHLAALRDEVADEQWILGYLSGIVSATGKDSLKQTDGNSIVFWIDNYCSQNPINKLYDAGDELIRTLNNRTVGR